MLKCERAVSGHHMQLMAPENLQVSIRASCCHHACLHTIGARHCCSICDCPSLYEIDYNLNAPDVDSSFTASSQPASGSNEAWISQRFCKGTRHAGAVVPCMSMHACMSMRAWWDARAARPGTGLEQSDAVRRDIPPPFCRLQRPPSHHPQAAVLACKVQGRRPVRSLMIIICS